MAHLSGTQGLAAGAVFVLATERVVIGREGDCDIVLMDNTVSRRHVVLIHAPVGRFTVRDLDSANGVFVNGQRTQQAVLLPGDLLQIGDSVFRFEA